MIVMDGGSGSLELSEPHRKYRCARGYPKETTGVFFCNADTWYNVQLRDCVKKKNEDKLFIPWIFCKIFFFITFLSERENGYGWAIKTGCLAIYNMVLLSVHCLVYEELRSIMYQSRDMRHFLGLYNSVLKKMSYRIQQQQQRNIL